MIEPRGLRRVRSGRRSAGVVATLALAAALAGCDVGDTRPGGQGQSSGAVTSYTYWISARAMSGGGSMTTPVMTGQTSTSGTVTRSGFNLDTIPVSVTANAGYVISYVKVNNVTVASGGATWSGSAPAATVANATVAITASFTPVQYKLTPTAGPGGSVSAAPASFYYYGNSASVTFQPISGWKVTAIQVTGSTVFTCNGVACTGPWAANASVKVTAAVQTSDIQVLASFAGNPTAQAGAGQVVRPGALVTLDGSGTLATTPPVSSYAWAQVNSTPAPVALYPPGAAATTFVAPATEGTYTFTLTVQPGGSFSNTTVIVTSNPAGVAQTQCESCHSAVGVGASTQVFANWSASDHAARYVMCFACHVGANAGGHPGDVSAGTVSSTDFTWKFATRGNPVGSSFCAGCHATAPQIVSDFAASVHASGPGTPGNCAGCHGDAHAARSGAASCVGCHVQAGVVTGHPFSVDATGGCTGCHDPHTVAALPAGAHPLHLARNIGCAACHVAVIGVVGFDPAGPATGASLPAPTFDPIAKTCSNVACHSVPPGEYTYAFPGGDGEPVLATAAYGGGATTPSWYAPPSGGCTACHDLTAPGGGRYTWHSGWHGAAGGNRCQLCHPDALGIETPTGPSLDTTLSTATTCDPGGRTPCATLHRNGSLDVRPVFRSACFGCH
ncbi:MAG: CxxxxCH/CxxCH domain-containing protein [Anaeromyxobacteraceae bacterium]